LYGAIIVLPLNVPAVCTAGLPTTNPGGNAAARAAWSESDFRLAAAAYDHPDSCYDREYLFQFSEMDPNIHIQALAQVTAARDGNLILSNSTITYPGTTAAAQALAGPLLFTTTTTPGLAMDGIFYWTGKGLNWDAFGHNPGSSDPLAKLACTPDANGYNTSAPAAVNYFEWCQDHNKPLQAKPFGDVSAGGPVTLPDPNLFTNGAWYGGSPYLGPDATVRATGPTGTTPPSGTIANSPTGEAGFAFMWHSHNEREITTNNIFPGGMLMMMLVDSREFVIDESN